MAKQNIVKLHTCTNDLSQRWYISVLYTASDGSRKRKQVYLGLNFHKTISARKKEGIRLVAFVKHQLEAGWNPEACSIEDYMTGNFEDQSTQYEMSFTHSIDFSLNKGKEQWSKKTYSGYLGAGKYFQESAADIGLSKTPIENIKRRDIKLIAERAKKKYSWSNKSYNKYLGYLKAIMSKLVEFEFIETNPVFNVKMLPVTEAQHYEPLTSVEKKLIQEHLYLKHYRFYVYLMVIYYTGIRPKEVLSLKISDIHLEDREIVIVPDLEAENSKTKVIRYVPINDHLYMFIKQMHLAQFPKDYYVFGSPAQTGYNGKKGYCVAMNPNYFTPSPVRVKRDTATRLWKKLVMEPAGNGGLGINKHMYGMKHTGADDYILAGASIEALKSMFGHTSMLMTERYISRLKDVYKNDILKQNVKF